MKMFFSKKFSALDIAILSPEPVDSHFTCGPRQHYIFEALGDAREIRVILVKA